MTDNKALETARYWLNEFGGVEPLGVLSRDLFHVSRALVALVADKPGAEVAGEEQVRSEQGERASTPSSPPDAVLELVEALRRRSIIKVERLTHGFMTCHHGWTCALCGTDWEKSEPEQHTPNCLLSRYRGGKA